MDNKIFDIAVDTDDFSDQGIFTVSLVKSPAIQEDFMYLSESGKETKRYNFNQYRQEVVGAVLIPDKLIYRFSEEIGEYYIRFSKETIEELVYKMSKDNAFNAFNIEHSLGTDDIYITELWIKEGSEDKSSNYGFSDLPEGTLFMKCKIDNEEVWEMIENEELKGFSVEMSSYIVPSNLSKIMEEKEKEVTPVATEKMSEETMDALVAKLAEALLPQIKEMLSKEETNEELSEDVVEETELGAEVVVSKEETTEASAESVSEPTEGEATVEAGTIEQTEQTTEESLSEETRDEASEEEVELSEVDAEAQLLSEQSDTSESLEEEKEPVVYAKGSAEFNELLNKTYPRKY